MKNGIHLKEPQVMYHKGKPKAVLLDIREYEAILEQLQDQADLEEHRKRMKEANTYIGLDEYLSKRSKRV